MKFEEALIAAIDLILEDNLSCNNSFHEHDDGRKGICPECLKRREIVEALDHYLRVNGEK